MNTRTFTGWLSAVFFAVGCGGNTNQAASGASGGAASTCLIGSERCDCFSDNTCKQGLACLSGLCVNASSGGGAAGSCPTGSERCSCHGDNTCDNGLQCLSNLCVAAATGGTAAIGGSTGGGGTAASSAAIGGVSAIGGSRAAVGSSASLGGTWAIGGASFTGGMTSSVAGNANSGGTFSGPSGGTVSTGGLTAFATGTWGGVKGTGGLNGTGGVGTDGGNAQNMTVVSQDQWDQINQAACVGWSGDPQWVPSSIEFVVDTSGSMTDVAKNTSDGQSKWAITNATLHATIDVLPEAMQVGLLLWPNKSTIPNMYTTPYMETGGVDACVNISAAIPLGRLGAQGATQRKAIASALDLVTPKGGTPMADAYSFAVDSTYGASPFLSGSKYVVLITDGQPTIQLGCMGTGEERRPVSEQPVLDAITGVYNNAFIKTFVIGSPGSESQSMTGADGRGWLSAAARAGGTAQSSTCEDSGGTNKQNFCHFDLSAQADFETSLYSVVQSIEEQVVSCDYVVSDAALQGQVLDPNKLNIIYEVNGSETLSDLRLIRKASSSSCPEGGGWFLNPDDPVHRTIRLCPSTCHVIHADTGAVLTARGGCDSVL